VDGLTHVLGPSIASFEDGSTDDANGIAQPVNMNAQCTALRIVRRKGLERFRARTYLPVSTDGKDCAQE
jgi:hypothetical protein